MATAPASANIFPLVSRTCIGETIRNALHLYVGRGRRYSVRALAEAAGVPERCIEAAKCMPDDPEYRPLTLENLASLCSFLGAPFASAILEPSGLGAFELMDGQPPLPSVLTADSAKPAETSREKIERLQRALFNAIEELTA
jgi:hypothetical protein